MISTSTPSAVELAHPGQVPRLAAAPHHREAAHQHRYAHARFARWLRDRRAGAPTAPGTPAPRSAWRGRALPLRAAAAARRPRVGRVQPRCRVRGSSRMSRAQPIMPSWNQRRSGTPKPRFGRVSTAAGTHGRITSRNSRLVVARRRAAPTTAAPASSIDLVIEHRASRFERMRHRRAIDFHQDVVGEVVTLIPLLQPRQQRPRAARICSTACALGQVPAAQHVRADDRFEQIVGKHRAAPDEPAFGSERQRAQPALAARVHRHHARAGADQRCAALARRRADARQRVGVRRVAGEQLVAAVAGQADGHVLARELRDVEGRNRRRVGERLVVVERERLGDAHAVGRDDLLVMFGAERRRGRCAPRPARRRRDRRSRS